MIICSNCGRRIKDDNAAVCPYCKVPTRYAKKTPAKEKKTNGFAIAGFVLGAASLFWGIIFVIPIVGISMNVTGLLNAEKCNTGKVMSRGGLGLAGAGLVFWLIILIILLVMYLWAASVDSLK